MRSRGMSVSSIDFDMSITSMMSIESTSCLHGAIGLGPREPDRERDDREHAQRRRQIGEQYAPTPRVLTSLTCENPIAAVRRRCR